MFLFPSELWMRGDVSFKSLTAAAQNGSQFKVGTEAEPGPDLEKKHMYADLCFFSEFSTTAAGEQHKDIHTHPGLQVSARQRGQHGPPAVRAEMLMNTRSTCD